MVRISIFELIKKRNRVRFVAVFVAFLLVAFFSVMLITKGFKKSYATTGNSENDPYIINESGYMWYDNTTDDSYFVRDEVVCDVVYYNQNLGVSSATNGIYQSDSCFKNRYFGDSHYLDGTADNKLTDKYVTIKGNNTVVAFWGGPHKFAGLTVEGNSVVTHAPLVYLDNNFPFARDFSNEFYLDNQTNFANFDGMEGINKGAAVYTPGYLIAANHLEKDFDLTSGALTARGELKKVDIETTEYLRVLDAKIDVTGRGYPGANGKGPLDQWDVLVTDVHKHDDGGDANTPIGLPYNYGGRGGQSYDSYCDDKVLGGGGNGYINTGGGTYSNTDGEYYGSGGSVSADIFYNFVPSQPFCHRYPGFGNFTDQPVGSLNITSKNFVYGASELKYGPGGGGAGRYDNYVARGGSGGGYIKLNTMDLKYTPEARIRSNGQYGINYFHDPVIAGGGGAGGVIEINQNNSYKNGTIEVTNFSAGNPHVFDIASGGKYSAADRPSNGLVNVNGKEDVSRTAWVSTYSGEVLSVAGGDGDVAADDNYSNYSRGSFSRELDYGGGGGGGGALFMNGNIQQTCYITSYDGLKNIPNYCENKNVVIDGATIITNKVLTSPPSKDTQRTFASLTIKNSGVLTHDVVEVGESCTATGTTGFNKKVDIIATGSIALESGGKIDVTSKGYIGGYKEPGHYNGSGPGGGGGALVGSANDDTGSGGGHGGNGGKGTQGNSGVSNDLSSNPVECGSGGGGVFDGDDAFDNPGGAGGGRIFLEANSLTVAPDSKIVANGDNTDRDGAGAGGTIVIKINGASPILAKIMPSLGGIGGKAGAEGSTEIQNATVSFQGHGYIEANGGSASTGGGGGGGGRILVKVTESALASPTVKKVLTAIDRNGTGGGFNPYSLQVNDLIKVSLTITNLQINKQTTITDQLLSNGKTGTERRVCAYQVGTTTGDCVNSAEPGNSNGLLGWIFTPTLTTANSCTIEYECKVQ